MQRYTRGERYTRLFGVAKAWASHLADLPPYQAELLEMQISGLLKAAVVQSVAQGPSRIAAADLQNPPITVKGGRQALKQCSGGSSRQAKKNKATNKQSAAVAGGGTVAGKRAADTPAKGQKKACVQESRSAATAPPAASAPIRTLANLFNDA
jgi:hypothetical protein